MMDELGWHSQHPHLNRTFNYAMAPCCNSLEGRGICNGKEAQVVIRRSVSTVSRRIRATSLSKVLWTCVLGAAA